MFKIVHFLLALVIILALAWLVSFDRRKISIRFVLQLIVIEIALAFFFLHAESGLFIIKYVSGFFESLLKFAAEGTNFVFGGMGEKGRDDEVEEGEGKRKERSKKEEANLS